MAWIKPCKKDMAVTFSYLMSVYYISTAMFAYQICIFLKTSGRGLHEMGKGSVRAAIASERYLSDVEVKLHNMHVHDQVFITKNDEHVEDISMKQ